MNHTQLLNYLVDKYRLWSYLEIGVQSTGNNFDKIKAKNKKGIDPDVKGIHIFTCTSDWYFETYQRKFDLIFIDGLHHADQVQRDFENSLKCLNDGGFIVIHDCLPEKESTTHVPRDSKVWHGDVYKWAMGISQYYVNFVTLNCDCGCMVVWLGYRDERAMALISDTWDFYIKNRKEYMNIIDPPEIDKYLPNRERVTI